MPRSDFDLGFEVENKGETPSWFKQVHGKNVISIDDKSPSATPDIEADGGIATQSGKSAHVFTADCVPVLLWSDHGKRPVAAVHAGWRGALQGIVREALHKMDVPLEKVHVTIGPAIGKCCFEVKQDFIEAFEAAERTIQPYLETRGGKIFADLIRFIVEEELEGVPEDLIDMTYHRCTFCSEPQLPSYRRNGNTETRIRSHIRKL